MIDFPYTVFQHTVKTTETQAFSHFVFPQVKTMQPPIFTFLFNQVNGEADFLKERNSPDPHSLNLLRAHLYVGGAHIQARSPRVLMQKLFESAFD